MRRNQAASRDLVASSNPPQGGHQPTITLQSRTSGDDFLAGLAPGDLP